jgi:ATP-binding cassette subfamily B protein
MNYRLSVKSDEKDKQQSVLRTAMLRLFPLMAKEGKSVMVALVAIFVTSAATLLSPVIIARTIDTAIVHGDFAGVLRFSALLVVVYLFGLVASYVQIRTMGEVGRNVLFRLRNALFEKLSELPVAFFNQNKAGDLISRINNDTDKLNQFFSQALVQFIGNFALILGTGIFLLVIDPKLGGAALLPALLVIILTQLLSPWVKRTSLRSLRKLGGMSGEIQESLANFKVIIAFNRLDFFREKFKKANEENYHASIAAGIASNTFTPLYSLASNLAQLIVLFYGLTLISEGSFTIGLLVGFILYVNNFYMPLRQLAQVWSSLQLALAGLDRISEVLALESDMKVLPAGDVSSDSLLEFRSVSFRYPDGKEVLRDINFKLEQGKTYALVGPTGGGKTTTASLMARLYDPTAGTVFLGGRDIRSYAHEERAKKIGFILQEPFLFGGTFKDNILYGNPAYHNCGDEEFNSLLQKFGVAELVAHFRDGLDTRVTSTGDTISLGQKQIIAFMRAVLRDPEILILDEATANIDTVTEQLLEGILKKLPVTTTKVIIAHRLNTIENADDIFFVNGGTITEAGDMRHAVDMLLHGKRSS